MVTRIGRRQKAHLYIQEWMEVRGLSDETLGDRIGVARQTIYRWRTEQENARTNRLWWNNAIDGTFVAILYLFCLFQIVLVAI